MPFAFVILFGLLSLCPLSIVVDGTVLLSFVPLLVSAGLIVVAIKLPQGEAQHLAAALPRGFLILAAFPAALMILQILPIKPLANPVWMSVKAGFPQEITGSISVDIGATAIALSRYLSVIGAAVLAAAITIDRFRSEVLAACVLAAIALISLAALGHDLLGASYFVKRGEALACACLGVTLAVVCGILIFERYETRRYKPNRSKQSYLLGALASLLAFFVCAGAVALTRSGSLIFAAAAGVLTISAAVVVRRFNLGRLGAVAIGGTAVIIAVTLGTVAATDPDLRFAFVKKDAAALELTQRILADAPFFGDGAGTFGTLVPIYQSDPAGPKGIEAVTAAAKLSIELGRPTLWIAIIAAPFAVYILLRGAANRGRDSFYAAGTGACIVTLMILAFIDTGIAGETFQLLFAIIMGLGLAQSKSRVPL